MLHFYQKEKQIICNCFIKDNEENYKHYIHISK